jgi:hypothetical protein
MLSTPRVSLSKLLYAITDFNDTSSFYKSYLISFAQGKFVFLWKIFPRKLFLQINELRKSNQPAWAGPRPRSWRTWVWESVLSLRKYSESEGSVLSLCFSTIDEIKILLIMNTNTPQNIWLCNIDFEKLNLKIFSGLFDCYIIYDFRECDIFLLTGVNSTSSLL